MDISSNGSAIAIGILSMGLIAVGVVIFYLVKRK